MRSPLSFLALLLASSLCSAASLTATITGVEGLVQVRQNEDAPWQRAAVGMELSEGAEFRTGPKSSIRFTIPPDQTVSLDRLGTVKLIEAVRDAGKVKTDLGMQYGRVRYDIEAATEIHDATIHSPGAALAVRGTRVNLTDTPPFEPRAVSLTGRARFKTPRRPPSYFGGKDKGKTTVSESNPAPAANALAASTIQSPVIARTNQQLVEQSYLFAHQGKLGGDVAFSNTPVPDADLPSLFTGPLNFVLRWNTPNQTNDLNIVVRQPNGAVFGNPPFILSLFPNNPALQRFTNENLPPTSSTGGRVGLNHIGPAGIEIASHNANYPRGTWIVGAYNFIFNTNLSSANPSAPRVPFTLEAFLNGKRQPLVLNLRDVLNNDARPVFGFVFRGLVARGEFSATALQLLDQVTHNPNTTTKPPTHSTNRAKRPPKTTNTTKTIRTATARR